MCLVSPSLEGRYDSDMVFGDYGVLAQRRRGLFLRGRLFKGSPICGSFLGSGQAAGRLHPGGYVLSPKAQYPFRDMDEQFASGWRRTRKHDNWPPRL
ncbi:hypothetical protein Bca101_049061 [Brassica carinata]